MRSDIETMKGDLVQEVSDTLLKDRACHSDDQNNVNSNTNMLSSVTSVAIENISTVTIVNKATNEMQARLALKDNIVFYNFQEPTGNLKTDLVKQDKDSVMDICDQMEVQVYDEDILNVKRIGKTHQKRKVHRVEIEVPRILIATFTESTKVKIMKMLIN